MEDRLTPVLFSAVLTVLWSLIKFGCGAKPDSDGVEENRFNDASIELGQQLLEEMAFSELWQEVQPLVSLFSDAAGIGKVIHLFYLRIGVGNSSQYSLTFQGHKQVHERRTYGPLSSTGSARTPTTGCKGSPRTKGRHVLRLWGREPLAGQCPTPENHPTAYTLGGQRRRNRREGSNPFPWSGSSRSKPRERSFPGQCSSRDSSTGSNMQGRDKLSVFLFNWETYCVNVASVVANGPHLSGRAVPQLGAPVGALCLLHRSVSSCNL